MRICSDLLYTGLLAPRGETHLQTIRLLWDLFKDARVLLTAVQALIKLHSLY